MRTTPAAALGADTHNVAIAPRRFAGMRPDFPAYATPLDKLGWWALRLLCVALLIFLLLPILVIVPLSFSASSFLIRLVWLLETVYAQRSHGVR